MEILKNLLSRKNDRDQPEDVTRIARKMGALLDKAAMEVFTAYRSELLTRPITYIVPAVWGAMKETEPDPLQMEMNQKIAPLVEEAFQAFEFPHLDDPHRFAVGYMLRGYLIAKITYMIEASRNQASSRPPDEPESPPEPDPFDSGTPFGHA